MISKCAKLKEQDAKVCSTYVNYVKIYETPYNVV